MHGYITYFMLILEKNVFQFITILENYIFVEKY